MEAHAKPLPEPTPLTEPFWNGCRAHRLVMPRCRACGQFHYPPGSVCPHCLEEQLDWQEVSGRGTVVSWVVYHHVYHPGFAAEVPYNVAVIELAEGPRLISNVVGCPPSALAVGMPVEVVFDDVTPRATLPRFRPIEHQGLR